MSKAQGLDQNKHMARGIIFIHSAPTALRPHIEWAIAQIFPKINDLAWTNQPVEPGAWRSEISWVGKQGSAATLGSKLKSWPLIRFEITEEPSPGSDGLRYAYTPALGIFSTAVGIHGDVLVHEDRLKSAVIQDALGKQPLAQSIKELLGQPWDDELEPFRYPEENAPVRWLHKVV